MDAYVGCMYYNTNEFDLCRKEQQAFEKACPLEWDVGQSHGHNNIGSLPWASTVGFNCACFSRWRLSPACLLSKIFIGNASKQGQCCLLFKHIYWWKTDHFLRRNDRLFSLLFLIRKHFFFNIFLDERMNGLQVPERCIISTDIRMQSMMPPLFTSYGNPRIAANQEDTKTIGELYLGSGTQ